MPHVETLPADAAEADSHGEGVPHWVEDDVRAYLRCGILARGFDDSFNVERLAADVAQSRGNLHRRLRDLVGESPSDLIRRMRLERAAQLLESGADSVGEVTYAVGFKSVAHFSNATCSTAFIRPRGGRLGSSPT